MKTVGVQIDDNLFELLESYCVTHRTTRSEAIRRAIRLYLKEVLKSEGKGRVTR